MNSVSVIIDGDDLDGDDINSLQSIIKSLREEGVTCEFIAHVSKPVTYKNLQDISLVYSGSPNITSLQKAIATARGDTLIFTTHQNITADNGTALPILAASLVDFMVAAPLRSNLLFKLIGVRWAKDLPYIIVSKSFAIRHSEKLMSPFEVIKTADKYLALLCLAHMQAPTILVNGTSIFIRPYFTILARKYRGLRFRISAYFEKQRVERLRKQVPPVEYTADIPIFIICRDRIEPLKSVVKWCEDEGLKNIYLIDNNSSYPPLLEYYSETPHEVIRLNANVGHTSPWKAGIVNVYAKNTPFIVTDPDVIPLPEAHGAVRHFCELLTAHPERTKVGFGLKIDDLPDTYALKKHVISWESQFWVSEVEHEVYDAEIDTTFALYRQNTPYVLGPGLRTGGKFVARHEPWYIDSEYISDELKYYRDHADRTVGSWGAESTDANQVYTKHMSKQVLGQR